MTKLGTSILIASSVLVFGCMPESATPASTTGSTSTSGGTTTTGGTTTGGGSSTVTAPVRGQTVLISDSSGDGTSQPDDDSGEVRYQLDTAIAAGNISIDVNYASDETETAYISVYGSSASSNYLMADIKLDSGYELSGDGYVGVRLRDDATYDGTTLAEFEADTWTTIGVEWDTVGGTYNVSIDGAAQSGFTLNQIDNDDVDDLHNNGWESVEYIVVKISSDAGTTVSTTPIYIDNLAIYSDAVGATAVFEDDFEDYTVGEQVDEVTDSPYHSNTFSAVVSDAFVE
jgi:hypothetical protein